MIFFIWATVTEISVKTVFGDQLNGLGTSWLGGDGPPRSKIKKKMHLVFWNFWLERPLLRYLLKSVLHWAALLHCLGLLATVLINSILGGVLAVSVPSNPSTTRPILPKLALLALPTVPAVYCPKNLCVVIASTVLSEIVFEASFLSSVELCKTIRGRNFSYLIIPLTVFSICSST